MDPRPFRTMKRLVELRRPQPRQIAADAPLREAARAIAEHRADALVVVLGGKAVGTIGAHEIAARLARNSETAVDQLDVEAAMRPLEVHATLATTVPEALDLLNAAGSDHLAVMESGQVVDLLSRAALLEQLIWHHTETIREMQLQDAIMHYQGVYSC